MRYLFQRNGIWYFRFQIPAKYRTFFQNECHIIKSLSTSNQNRREIKISLRTRSLNTAKLRSSEIQTSVWRIMELIENNAQQSDKECDFSHPMPISSSENANAWGAFEAEKQRVIANISASLETLECNSKLYQTQQNRMTFFEEHSPEANHSIHVIEQLWDRSVKPLKAAMEYMNGTYIGYAMTNSEIYEEISNAVIALYQLNRNVQAELDYLRIDEAKAILNQIQECEGADSWNAALDVGTGNISLKTSTQRNEMPVDTSLNRTRNVRQCNTNPESLLEAFCLERQNMNKGQKETKAIKSAFRLVHELLECSDVSSVGRDDVNRIIPEIKRFPKAARSSANKKHFDGLNVFEIIERNKELNLAVREESQAMRDIERTSTVYNWLLKHGWVQYNPFYGLADSKSISRGRYVYGMTEDEKTRKLPFTKVQLAQMLSHPVFTENKYGRNYRERVTLYYQYWVILFSILTGARPNEICQLRIEDFILIDGVLCFDIHEKHDTQSVKNKSAVRRIPVPEQLFRLGFQEYFDFVSGGEQLFPDLTFTLKSGYYGKVEDWFKRVFGQTMGLSAQNQSFYSFRHTFINDYQEKGRRCPIVQQIVGHKNGNITDDTYGGRFDAKTLKAKIDELDMSDIFADVKPFRKPAPSLAGFLEYLSN